MLNDLYELMGLKSSNAFIDEWSELFNDLHRKSDSGLDCSEMVEDLNREFGGRAVLLLSKDWRKNKQAQFIDSTGEEKYYYYHYAWEKDHYVYDPMLGYYRETMRTYLNKVIGRDGNIFVSFVETFPLKTYLP